MSVYTSFSRTGQVNSIAPRDTKGQFLANPLQRMIDRSPRMVAQRAVITSLMSASQQREKSVKVPTLSTVQRKGVAQRVKRNNKGRKKVYKTRSVINKNARIEAKINKANILPAKARRSRRGVARYGNGDGTRYGVGRYATYTGVSTRDIQRRFSAKEKAAVNRLGRTSGCHTCGKKVSGWADHHWTPDHQPPLSLSNLVNYKGHLYPHCRACSNTQGGVLAGIIRQRNNQ